EHSAFTPLTRCIWPAVSNRVKGASGTRHIYNRSVLQNGQKAAHVKVPPRKWSHRPYAIRPVDVKQHDQSGVEDAHPPLPRPRAHEEPPVPSNGWLRKIRLLLPARSPKPPRSAAGSIEE